MIENDALTLDSQESPFRFASRGSYTVVLNKDNKDEVKFGYTQELAKDGGKFDLVYHEFCKVLDCVNDKSLKKKIHDYFKPKANMKVMGSGLESVASVYIEDLIEDFLDKNKSIAEAVQKAQLNSLKGSTYNHKKDAKLRNEIKKFFTSNGIEEGGKEIDFILARLNLLEKNIDSKEALLEAIQQQHEDYVTDQLGALKYAKATEKKLTELPVLTFTTDYSSLNQFHYTTIGVEYTCSGIDVLRTVAADEDMKFLSKSGTEKTGRHFKSGTDLLGIYGYLEFTTDESLTGKRDKDMLEVKTKPIRCNAKDLKEAFDQLRAVGHDVKDDAANDDITQKVVNNPDLEGIKLAKNGAGNPCTKAGVQVTYSQHLKKFLKITDVSIDEFFEYFSGDVGSYKPYDKTKQAVNLRCLVGKLAQYIEVEDSKYTDTAKYPLKRDFKFTELDPLKTAKGDIVVFMEQRHPTVDGPLQLVQKYLHHGKEEAIGELVEYCEAYL